MDFFGQVTELLFILSIVLTLGFILLYFYFQFSYTYWRRKGVPHLNPRFPLGNNDCIGYEQFSYGKETVEWYRHLKDLGFKCGGAWSWSKPVLLLTDPDYIKDLLMKDFNYFCDRDFYHNPKHDRLIESLFVLEKDEWRNLRQKLTPVFTSAKMRSMFPTVVKCSDIMLQYIESNIKSGKDMDIKETLASFTTDVIGSVAFGLDFASFTSREAIFRQMGKEIFRPTFRSKISIILCRLCEKTAMALGIKNIPDIVIKFFTGVIKESVTYRKNNKIVKPDFLQVVMDLYESNTEQKYSFTFEDLIANVILFFIAGFDTSSSTMYFALYELSKQPKLQEKVRDEIKRVLEQHGGKLTYESWQEMTYLRQVVDETLRMYPVVQNLARICVKPYMFKGTDFIIDPGTTVVVSTLALGRDPEYYPDPEIFDPDRFSPENKTSINPFVYLPFGGGPRNCLGRRFGLMQSSIGLIQILCNFRVSISPKTKMPVTLKKGVFLMQTNETLYLKAEKL